MIIVTTLCRYFYLFDTVFEDYIEGVPPSRFTELFQAFREVDRFRQEYLPDRVGLSLSSLSSMAFRGGKAIAGRTSILPKSSIIPTFQSLLQGVPVAYEELLPTYIATISTCKDKQRESRMATVTIKWVMYLYLLETLKLLRKDKPMEAISGPVHYWPSHRKNRSRTVSSRTQDQTHLGQDSL